MLKPPMTQHEQEVMERHQSKMLTTPPSMLIDELSMYFDSRTRTKQILFSWFWRNKATFVGRALHVAHLERAHLALQVSKLTGKPVDRILKETDEAVEARLLQE